MVKAFNLAPEKDPRSRVPFERIFFNQSLVQPSPFTLCSQRDVILINVWTLKGSIDPYKPSLTNTNSNKGSITIITRKCVPEHVS